VRPDGSPLTLSFLGCRHSCAVPDQRRISRSPRQARKAALLLAQRDPPAARARDPSRRAFAVRPTSGRREQSREFVHARAKLGFRRCSVEASAGERRLDTQRERRPPRETRPRRAPLERPDGGSVARSRRVLRPARRGASAIGTGRSRDALEKASTIARRRTVRRAGELGPHPLRPSQRAPERGALPSSTSWRLRVVTLEHASARTHEFCMTHASPYAPRQARAHERSSLPPRRKSGAARAPHKAPDTSTCRPAFSAALDRRGLGQAGPIRHARHGRRQALRANASSRDMRSLCELDRLDRVARQSAKSSEHALSPRTSAPERPPCKLARASRSSRDAQSPAIVCVTTPSDARSPFAIPSGRSLRTRSACVSGRGGQDGRGVRPLHLTAYVDKPAPVDSRSWLHEGSAILKRSCARARRTTGAA